MNHPLYQLGRGPTRKDPRNFQLKALVKAKLSVPPKYSVDLAFPGSPLRMYANDIFGDCVIAARANEETRFALAYRREKITITDKEVLKQYFLESDGVDSGLVMLDSLNSWRKQGWIAARKRRKIMAFAQLDPTDTSLVKQAIYANLGCYVGLDLPTSAARELDEGLPWKATKDRPGSWGGHCVYLSGYNSQYVTCLTWAQRQLLTWAFFRKYCAEAYAVIPPIPTAKQKAFIDSTKLRSHLDRV